MCQNPMKGRRPIPRSGRPRRPPLRLLIPRPNRPRLLLVFLSALSLLGLGAPSPSRACRFWALIGEGYPEDLIEQHLRSGALGNLRMLSSSNRDGWGVASFPAEPGLPCLNLPLMRRGRPPANWYSDTKFDLAVDEMVCLRPRAALGHVRAGGTGHQGIPDPHPFSHERWLFAQNGAIPVDTLVTLLSEDDIHYLNDHPPEYVNGYVDSELFFLYLLKVMHQGQGSIEESLVRAVSDVAIVTGGTNRLNFVLTAGDTLYALRFAPADSADPVMYSPATGAQSGERPSTWYVVASQLLGSALSGWAHLPPQSLGVFVPGEAPRFVPIFDPASVRGEPGSPDGIRSPDRDQTVRVGSAAPNPGLGEIRLPLRLRRAESVRCDIWSVNGRLTRSFHAGNLPAGEHLLRWDGLDQSGTEAPSGQYFWRIRAGNDQETRRVTLVR
jgi:predicted glutamine amidotransferase